MSEQISNRPAAPSGEPLTCTAKAPSPETAPESRNLGRDRRFGYRLLVGLIILIVLLLAGLAGYLYIRGLHAQRQLDVAQAAIERRHFDEALVQLEEYLEVWPRSARVQFLAGRTARRAESYDKAGEHLSRAQQLGWEAKAVDLERVLIRVQRGETTLTEQTLAEILEKDPEDAVLVLEAVTLGYRRNRETDTMKALDCLNAWLKRDPQAVQAYIWRGDLWHRMMDRNNARQDYQQAVDLDPSNDDARLRLAKELLDVPRPEEAIGHYQQLHQRMPQDRDVLFGLAMCKQHLGKPEEAAELLDILLKNYPEDSEVLRERGRLALARGQYLQAEQFLTEAVLRRQSDSQVFFLLWQCLLRSAEQQPKAVLGPPWVLLYQRMRRLQTELCLTYYQQVKKDEDRLGVIFIAVAGKERNNAELYYEAGQIFLRNGLPDEARYWFGRAVRVDPSHNRAYQALSALVATPGQPGK